MTNYCLLNFTAIYPMLWRVIFHSPKKLKIHIKKEKKIDKRSISWLVAQQTSISLLSMGRTVLIARGFFLFIDICVPNQIINFSVHSLCKNLSPCLVPLLADKTRFRKVIEVEKEIEKTILFQWEVFLTSRPGLFISGWWFYLTKEMIVMPYECFFEMVFYFYDYYEYSSIL